MDAIQRRSRPAAWLVSFAAIGGLCLVSAVHAAEPQAGTWQPHKMTMYFLGISSLYSCEGMQTAVTYLLKKVGAKLNAPVTAQPCLRGYGTPERLSQAELNFSVLVPATAGSAGGTVPGTWRHVEISSQHSGTMLHGTDCELVSEFQEDVLKFFATRDVRNRLRCLPFQDTSLVYDLSFEVFEPVERVSGPAD